MAFILMSVAVAAFSTGAYLDAKYPSWLTTASMAAVDLARTSGIWPGDAPQPRAISPTDEQRQSGAASDRREEAATSWVPEAATESTPAAAAESSADAPASPGESAIVSTPATADAGPRMPAEPPVAPRDDRRAASTRSRMATVDSPSLSGEWSINTGVASNRLNPYDGLRLVYYVRLRQVGNELTGTGYKLREDDRSVRGQIPVTVYGEIEGNRVVITVTEPGAGTGKLVLDRESADVLRGRFSSDAPPSTGVVEAHRERGA
jgi:hypothetical protein